MTRTGWVAPAAVAWMAAGMGGCGWRGAAETNNPICEEDPTCEEEDTEAAIPACGTAQWLEEVIHERCLWEVTCLGECQSIPDRSPSEQYEQCVVWLREDDVFQALAAQVATGASSCTDFGLECWSCLNCDLLETLRRPDACGRWEIDGIGACGAHDPYETVCDDR